MNPMSKEELRIEIAKLQGFDIRQDGNYVSVDGHGFYGWSMGEVFDTYFIPDYPNDIKAAYELEGSVPEEKRDKYEDNLLTIVGFDGFEYFEIAHATPEQRCHAYYLTMKGDK